MDVSSILNPFMQASATSTASQNTVVQSSFSDAKIHQALGKEMKESEQYKLSEAEQSNQSKPRDKEINPKMMRNDLTFLPPSYDLQICSP